MPNQTSNETLLFTECINLNTERCLYSKNPEAVLSLVRDPEKFAIKDQKVQELNELCSGCDWYQKI